MYRKIRKGIEKMSTEMPTCDHCDKEMPRKADEGQEVFKLLEAEEMDEHGDVDKYYTYHFCSWDCLVNWIHEEPREKYKGHVVRIAQRSFRGICSECGQTVTCPVAFESRVALAILEEGELFEHKCPSCNQMSAFKIITKNA